jgi:hypothetical protein
VSAVVPLKHSELAAVAPNYEAMRRAIAVCEKVDEIAALADKAVGAQAYFRQSKDIENEMGASRIRVRAERRLGEILKRMAETGERASRGGDPESNVARRDIGDTPTLADMGIPRDRASRAMHLAEVPEQEFEAALAEPRIAQPRRILDQRRDTVPITKTLNLWGRVRDLGTAISAGEVPPIEFWRHNLQPFQVDELRRSIPVIVSYLSRIQEELDQ